MEAFLPRRDAILVSTVLTIKIDVSFAADSKSGDFVAGSPNNTVTLVSGFIFSITEGLRQQLGSAAQADQVARYPRG